MLPVAAVREEFVALRALTAGEAFGIEKLHFKRSALPAITHVDFSA